MKKQVLQAAITAGGIIVAVILAAYFLRRDEGFVKSYDFYETDEQYDVLYFGSSHMVMGILPMEIWQEYGITSFNLANEGQKISGDYWILKNALEYKKPSVVVIDVYTVAIDQVWDESTVDFLHESLDPMPFSQTKIEAIRDLVPEEKRPAFFLPFSVYHNRWEEIDQDFFVKKTSCQKGAYENTSHAQPQVNYVEELATLPEEEMELTETVGMEYLRKSVELCQEQDVSVVLTAIPFHGTEPELRYINSVYRIAQEYDVPFINGFEENVIDPKCDFLDYTHLNSSGARKWSLFLGGYLKEQYDLPDRRGDAAYAGWADDYAEYRIYEVNQLNATTDLYAYLMLLADDGFYAGVRVAADSAVYGDEVFWELMKNAGGVEMPEDGSTEHIFALDHSGEKEAFSPENGMGLPEGTDADIEIVVYDSRRGAIVSHAAFSSSDENAMVFLN